MMKKKQNKNPRLSNKVKNRSGLHNEVIKWLYNNKLYIGFKSEMPIDRYTVDELNENKKLILEINGDHWHANPRKYNANDIIGGTGKKTAKQIWERDSEKIEVLQGMGYDVIIIWESDFRNKFYRKKILKNIKELLCEYRC